MLVLRNDCWDQIETLKVVIIDIGIRMLKMVAFYLDAWSLLREYTMRIRLSIYVLRRIHRLRRLHDLSLVSTWGHLGRELVISGTILSIIVVLTLRTSLVSIEVLCHLTILLLLQQVENLNDQLHNIWSLKHAKVRWQALSDEPSLIVEISLILCIVILPPANLFKFIVSDSKTAVFVNDVIVQINSGCCSLVGLLEANKGSG